MDNWNDSQNNRPTQADFEAGEGCLDQLVAWRNFGGLSLTEVFVRFCGNPQYYQEDFMWIGGVAFAYYFPVLERYILESRVGSDDDDEVEAMWILAHCIKMQFEVKTSSRVHHLRQRVLSLVSHVRHNLAQYCHGLEEQQRIDSAWRELECKLGPEGDA